MLTSLKFSCISPTRVTLDTYGIDNMRILGDGSQLEISGAQVEDSAAYTCIASNPAGRADRIFDLSVFGEDYSSIRITWRTDNRILHFGNSTVTYLLEEG